MASSSSLQRGERRGRWGSPERTVVWTEPKPKPKQPARKKVAVVYYLCHRDGHLEHPHFLELELPRPSSSNPAPGLHLRDFTARLAALRGDAMAGMYSWSSKRGYRNGYVWQDLADDDIVLPAHGSDEYVLKGSPIVVLPQLPPPQQEASSFGQEEREGRRCRRNWASFDLGDCSSKPPAVGQQSAATQTDHGGPEPETELAVHEISPPPSSGSPETPGREVGLISGGRMRASAALMRILSCGSMAAAVKRGHARTRSDLAMASASNRLADDKEVDAYASARAECVSVSGGAGGVERDYFSGSLVEKRGGGGGVDAALLKRSSSCNADRGAAKLKLPVPAKEVRAGCLARAPKKNMTKSTAAPTRDGGECKGATADEQ